MLPDRVSNPGPLTYESGALPIALRGPAIVCLVVAYFASGNGFQCHQRQNSEHRRRDPVKHSLLFSSIIVLM